MRVFQVRCSCNCAANRHIAVEFKPIYIELTNNNRDEEESIESSEFINFSLRDYVEDIRKTDPRKCWPFGSLGDPEIDKEFASSQYAEPMRLTSQTLAEDIKSSDDTSHHSDASNSSAVEITNGKEDQSKTTTDMTKLQGTYNKNGKAICKGFIMTASKNSLKKAESKNKTTVTKCGLPVEKAERTRSLAAIYAELEGPANDPRIRYDITTPDNVNTNFATEIEDHEESDDDLTLNELFRKRKGVRIIPSGIKKRKRTLRVEAPRPFQDENTKRGSNDSNENDSNVVSKIRSRKTMIDDEDKEIVVMRKRRSKSCVRKKGKAFRKQKSFPLPNREKSDINMEIEEVEATKTDKEDPVMVAVVLLGSHFSEEKEDCAWVKKKMLELSNKPISANTTSKTITKDAVLHEKTNKKFVKQVETDNHPKVANKKISSKPSKRKTASGFQVANREPTICILSKNPADFSTPNAENEFMIRV